jgi:hypothetical protein
VDHRAKDDRRNNHLDQIDESISQRFQAFTQTRVNVPNHDAEHDSDENLDIKNAIPRFPGGRILHERIERGFFA